MLMPATMPFERAVETVQSGGVKLSFDFDRAYWMSGLQPTDPTKGVARVDARSLAIPARPYSLAPEAGGPATTDQTGPFVMIGQAWRGGGSAAAPANAFVATLTVLSRLIL